MNFVQKMRGLLFEPSQTFNTCKDETLREAIEEYLFFIVLLLFIATLFIALNPHPFGIFEAGILGIFIPLFIIIGIWIEGAIIHIGVYLFGGRKGINQTIKAVIYSTYVAALLIIISGFLEQIPYIDRIPFIIDISEIIVVIWPLGIIILGVRQLHEITTWNAIAGVLLTQFILPIMLSTLFWGSMPQDFKNYASNEDSIFSIEPTLDGTYILSGKTESSETGVDAWLIKMDVNGSEQWKHIFGGAKRDILNFAMQTSDGGYILAGETEHPVKGADGWLIKTGANGNERWNKTFGGEYSDMISMAQETSDGGFVLTGYTESFGDGGDGWLIKTDSTGNEKWSKTFGDKYLNKSLKLKIPDAK